MRILGIDLETYSSVDIKKSGLYKYAENSEILIFAYSWDGAPAEVVDFTAGELLPDDVLDALTDPDVLKTAYNAAFERNVIGHWLGYNLDPSQWFCTMVLGYTVGMPGGLDALGKVLHLSEDKQKMQEGKKLIQYFCKPCRPTKVNKGRTRNLPEHNPEGWKTFKEYCKRDVDSETAIRKKLWRFYPIESERRLWALDQIINDRGVLVDLDMARCAIDISARLKDQLLTEARELTGLDNPNSRQQALEWFESVEGYRPDAFDKAARAELLTTALDPRTRRFIEIKNLLGKTSVAKYEAMVNAYCVDNRVHGMLQFYGASRTGRWAGRLLQLHNLPQNHLEDLDDARNFVKANDLEALELVYGNVSDVLSQLIRTAFIAPPGHRFIVADFAAIEARVIAWLADEKWRMKVFADGGDIYCASASQMFKVPVEKHGINGHLRQKGKVAELACGYGGGVSALCAFGADKLGMTQADMEETIAHWRKASPNIVKMWGDVEKCAKRAIRMKGTPVKYAKGMEFVYQNGLLLIRLPSGRKIAYVRPKIQVEDMGTWQKESLSYEGSDSQRGWTRLYTWGGKLVENIVQGIARDCLANCMLNLEAAGYRIVMHVHDECICEMPNDKGSLEKACEIMGRPIPWAPGLLLRADGYETTYYKKD